MAKSQSGEREEVKASQSLKVDVQDTDGVRQSIAFSKKNPGQFSSQEDSLPQIFCFIQWQKSQSGEGEEGKASQSVKVDVQDTDGVRKVIAHTISLMPSIRKILVNLLVKRTANQIFSFIQWQIESQSGEVEEGKASQSVKVDVQDTDGVRKVIAHTFSLMPSIRTILVNL
ncbi:unnamed protein product [Mytilus coruscus]|uniref:Uncharacterized protein n=1 Tax=Mytilus coruscus TaxID=42192 RepID=A0A6J8E6L2_MYTCO|nr:unnamed protein product [Mytilus coruscus]